MSQSLIQWMYVSRQGTVNGNMIEVKEADSHYDFISLNSWFYLIFFQKVTTRKKVYCDFLSLSVTNNCSDDGNLRFSPLKSMYPFHPNLINIPICPHHTHQYPIDNVYNIICAFIQHKKLLMALNNLSLLTDYTTCTKSSHPICTCILHCIL